MKRIIQLIIISLTLSFALANAPQKLPDFSLKSIDDKTIRSTSFTGNMSLSISGQPGVPHAARKCPILLNSKKPIRTMLSFWP
jgi:hypothetical protein